ncbi:tumor necrosis factor receptor superfamily member 6 isoform X2 [Mixophyes fleayi]|uniref:tumor necrosis factor receptor superfamily member 6 isoform X2 n=1 Tax=Mixophyes fleayi TaxID=3061075 RepID=UPI003F4DA6C7
MKILPVSWFLVLCVCSCVLPLKIHNDSSDKHVKKKAELFLRLLKRQTNCPNDEYLRQPYCCKNCGEGTHVQSHCTTEHGNSQCKPCDDGVDYMDKRNGYGLDVLDECTVTQNTKCKCREAFFCKEIKTSDSEECTDCQHCTQCNSGIAEPCTAVKDTVCKSTRYHWLWAIPLAGFAIALIITLCILYRRNMESRELMHSQESNGLINTQPSIDPDLPDIDLSPHLCSIAEELHIETVLKCVRKMHLKEQMIENVLHDYESKGANEQKYQLLRSWYESCGCAGAYKLLITTLRSNNNHQSAQKVKQLVTNENSE